MNWIKKLLRVVRSYSNDIQAICTILDGQRADIDNALRYMKRATKVHFDVGADMQSTVIVCGAYRGRDHVQVFRINPGDFARLVDQMREVQRVGTIGAVDAPHGLDVTIKRELKC